MPIPQIPAAQHRIIRLWVLGGPYAAYPRKPKTVRALEARGFLVATSNGFEPSKEAREYVNSCEQEWFNK